MGKGSGTSLKEFLDLVQKHTGRKAIIKILPDQPGDVPYTCADVSKAQRMLGYKSRVSFEEGIRRTAKWYKETFPSVPTAEEQLARAVEKRQMTLAMASTSHAVQC